MCSTLAQSFPKYITPRLTRIGSFHFRFLWQQPSANVNCTCVVVYSNIPCFRHLYLIFSHFIRVEFVEKNVLEWAKRRQAVEPDLEELLSRNDSRQAVETSGTIHGYCKLLILQKLSSSPVLGISWLKPNTPVSYVLTFTKLGHTFSKYARSIVKKDLLLLVCMSNYRPLDMLGCTMPYQCCTVSFFFFAIHFTKSLCYGYSNAYVH